MKEQETVEQFKLVTIQFSETAQIIVRASNDEEATEAVFSSFPNIPDLRILLIEDADPELVAEVKTQKAAQETSEGKVLN